MIDEIVFQLCSTTEQEMIKRLWNFCSHTLTSQKINILASLNETILYNDSLDLLVSERLGREARPFFIYYSKSNEQTG